MHRLQGGEIDEHLRRAGTGTKRKINRKEQVPVPGTPQMLIDLATLQPVHYSWRGYDEISPNLARAVIARGPGFLHHHGFDWKDISDAIKEHQRHPHKRLRGDQHDQPAGGAHSVPPAGQKLGSQGRRGLSDRAGGGAMAQEAHPYRLSEPGRLGAWKFRRGGSLRGLFRRAGHGPQQSAGGAAGDRAARSGQMARQAVLPLRGRRSVTVEDRAWEVTRDSLDWCVKD